MKTEKIIFLVLGGLTLLVFGGILVFSLNEGRGKKNSQILSYSKTDVDRPKVKATNLFFDFGQMKASDEKTTDFTIENTGGKPLLLFDISSSCDCTFGQIIIGDIKSPEVNMHAKEWMGELKAGEKAIVKVIYRPAIMPVKGVVTREVYLSTNDPDNPKLTFIIKAFVD